MEQMYYWTNATTTPLHLKHMSNRICDKNLINLFYRPSPAFNFSLLQQKMFEIFMFFNSKTYRRLATEN